MFSVPLTEAHSVSISPCVDVCGNGQVVVLAGCQRVRLTVFGECVWLPYARVSVTFPDNWVSIMSQLPYLQAAVTGTEIVVVHG